MKKAVFLTPLKGCIQVILLLAICFSFGAGSVNTAHASALANSDSCGQRLADAKAKFMALLPADGSVPATPEVQAAAQHYIFISKQCYDELQVNNPSASLQTETTTPIDDGGMILGNNKASADYVTTGQKWSSNTITYSFMPSGISFANEGYGNSVAISALPTFQPCFITDIQNAFAAWQAVANVHFVQVDDNGAAFDAADATGDIRIAAHAFDGQYGTLAHAYFPPPNGTSAAGDLHFDSAENWTCNTNGIDIGLVALHEIGHSLGLDHQTAPPTAVMNPTYNPSLTGLQSDDISGITAIYGSASISNTLGNDNWPGTQVLSIPYINEINTTTATEEADDPQVPVLCDNKMLHKGDKSVWYQYTPSTTTPVLVDTMGSDYDTYIAVWTGSSLSNLSFVACDEDTLFDLQSRLSFTPKANTTYYIEVAGYSGTTTIYEPNLGGNLKFHLANSSTASQTEVYISGDIDGEYFIPKSGSVRTSYAGVDSGPLKVDVTGGLPIVASLNDLWSDGTNPSSAVQLMGLPSSLESSTYVFPAYNNVSLDDQLRIGNVGSAPTIVTVTIGGVFMHNYNLDPGTSVRASYAGVDSGPVVVQSSGNVPIIASIRDSWWDGSKWSSYAQLMGLPGKLLSNTYVFPAYNNVSLDDQLRFGNVGSAHTVVTVTIGGVYRGSYPLDPGQSTRVSYSGLDSGPVIVQSSGNVPIIASIRDSWKDGNNKWSSYSQLMGLPASVLSSTYVFPVYDNVNVDAQLRFGNVGGAPTVVTVTIGGVFKGNYNLDPGQSTRVYYAGVNAGPVIVQSSGNVPIIASIRDSLWDGSVWSSYSQIMGLPASLLSYSYVFPAYNDVSYSNELRMAVP